MSGSKDSSPEDQTTDDWHQKLMKALKESKAGKSTALAELSRTARQEIISSQYLSRLFKNRIDGCMDVKMKAAGDE
jgi:hypothetical protein